MLPIVELWEVKDSVYDLHKFHTAQPGNYFQFKVCSIWLHFSMSNVKPVAIFQFICGGERADMNFPLMTGPVKKVFSKSEIYTIFCSPCEQSVLKEIP